MLSILRKHIPEAEITLWPSNVDNGVEQLLLKEFPGLNIAKPRSEDLKRAFKECDFLLHGSGASIVAERDLVRWQEETGKPYGIYGITFPMKRSSAKCFKTGAPQAKIFYLITTPHTAPKPDGNKPVDDLGDKNDVVIRLNTISGRVMKEENIEIIDAYDLLAKKLELAGGDGYHWSRPGYEMITSGISRRILPVVRK